VRWECCLLHLSWSRIASHRRTQGTTANRSDLNPVVLAGGPALAASYDGSSAPAGMNNEAVNYGNSVQVRRGRGG
jgi:hypothetical protein